MCGCVRHLYVIGCFKHLTVYCLLHLMTMRFLQTCRSKGVASWVLHIYLDWESAHVCLNYSTFTVYLHWPCRHQTCRHWLCTWTRLSRAERNSSWVLPNIQTWICLSGERFTLAPSPADLPSEAARKKTKIQKKTMTLSQLLKMGCQLQSCHFTRGAKTSVNDSKKSWTRFFPHVE